MTRTLISWQLKKNLTKKNLELIKEFGLHVSYFEELVEFGISSFNSICPFLAVFSIVAFLMLSILRNAKISSR